jgi:hypothetical protein
MQIFKPTKGSIPKVADVSPRLVELKAKRDELGLIGASFMVAACRSVRGAPLKAATIGLWPVDDFHRTAQGHHRD